MSAPSVSVILPTRDRAALLPRAMASVLNQTFGDFELIVVDDGSTDGTRALVEASGDPRVRYLANEGPPGDAQARNHGLAHATGTWLAFQDSDDEWAAHKLAVQMRIAAQVPAEVALIGGALLRVTPDGVERIGWPAQGTGDTGAVDPAGFLYGFCAYLQSTLVRRSALQALGGFDVTLKARSDFDACLRLIDAHPAVATREVVAISHETGDGISGDPQRRRDDIERLLSKHAALIAASAATHGRYLYDLARAELACDRRAAALRIAARSLRQDPRGPRSWALLALAPLGAHGLQVAARARRHFGALR